jgi:DNA modification methylase
MATIPLSQAGAAHPHVPLSITYRAIANLIPDPANPRTHTKKQIRQIAASIAAFGFNVPILVNSQSKIVAGHGRILACMELGWTEVPVIRLEHLTPSQAKAYQIADNRLTENSAWDEVLLAQSLKELSELDLDFKLEAIGFEMAEIDLRIEQLDMVDDEKIDEVVLPQSNDIAVSKLGDLWLLGEHRILCGNALLPTDYELLLDGHQVNIVFTDPPYNVPIKGHVTGNGTIQHREFQMAGGEMSIDQFTAFLKQVCVNLVDASTDGSIHYVCMDWRHLPEILTAGNSTYTELKNLCVWAKDNAGMGSLYRSQHELVLVFKNGKGKHVNNIQLGQFGRYRSNLWKYPGANSFARATDEGNMLELHPTVKPVAMIVDALYDCSHRANFVLDPFLGSGSTLIAAERTGRRCCGMELDPLYVDTAIRRWQNLTGMKAVHAISGKSFDALNADCARVGTPECTTIGKEQNHVQAE